MPATESQLDTPSTSRLVIRVKLIPQEELPAPARPRSSKGPLLLIVGVIAALVGWFALSNFRSDPSPPPTAKSEPVPKPTVAEPAKPTHVEAEVPQQQDPPLSPVHQELPDVPRSALNTITGTVRVSVRVSIDKQGGVIAATSDDRGPSRYFERLALDASKQWTFTPTRAEQKRTMLVKFNFTRDGATAQAIEP